MGLASLVKNVKKDVAANPAKKGLKGLVSTAKRLKGRKDLIPSGNLFGN